RRLLRPTAGAAATDARRDRAATPHPRRQRDADRPDPERRLPRGRATRDRAAARMSVAEHDLLLRATLGPEPEARDAYARWREQADLATLDRASQRVLSLLAERLDGQDDAIAAKVRRIARFTWLRTQVLLQRTTPAVRALTESGIPVMLNKGAAVLAH